MQAFRLSIILWVHYKTSIGQVSSVTKSLTPKRKCPQCKKLTVEKYRPFCSERCQQLDLGKWFNESYSVPGEERYSANDDDENY